MVLIKNNLQDKVNIKTATEQVAIYLQDIFLNSPKAINHITTHLAKVSGKHVRANLLLICAMDNAALIKKEAIDAACAVEIFHLATLIHDDIIDNAPIRRGIESVQSKFSQKEAVIAGDYLFGVSLGIIANIHKPFVSLAPKFANVTKQICLGELRQHGNNFNGDLSFFDYLKTIYGKTAALFYMSAYGGAAFAYDDMAQIKKIGRLGTYFGMAFQILDDCKDYTMDVSQAKKPTQNDIVTGVVNLPLLLAIAKDDNLKAMLDERAYKEIIIRVKELKTTDQAFEISQKYVEKAQKILKNIEPLEKRDKLKELFCSQLKKH